MTATQNFSKTISWTRQLMSGYLQWYSKNNEGTFRLVEAPKYADWDYAIYNGDDLDHLVEVKLRRSTMAYPDQRIPFRKFAVGYTKKEIYKEDLYYLMGLGKAVYRIPLWWMPDKVEFAWARRDRAGSDEYAIYLLERFEQLPLESNLVDYEI